MKASMKKILGIHDATLKVTDNRFTVVSVSGHHLGPFEFSPDPFEREQLEENTLPTRSVLQAIDAFAGLSAAVYQVEGNDKLSVLGKVDALVVSRDQAATKLAALARSLLEYEKVIKDIEATRYGVPKLSQGDAIGIAYDREIRDRIHGARSATGEQVMKALVAGNDERLMIAILRDPFTASEFYQTTQSAWFNLVDQRDPDGLETLNLMRKALDWARGVVWVITAVMQQSLLGLSKEELYLKTRQYGVNELWSISSGDASIFERRRLAAA